MGAREGEAREGGKEGLVESQPAGVPPAQPCYFRYGPRALIPAHESRSKGMGQYNVDGSCKVSHRHRMKASVTDKIYFCSGLGVRKPRGLPRGERTRAAQSPRRTGQVWVAGCDLPKPAKSQSNQQTLAGPQG